MMFYNDFFYVIISAKQQMEGVHIQFLWCQKCILKVKIMQNSPVTSREGVLPHKQGRSG